MSVLAEVAGGGDHDNPGIPDLLDRDYQGVDQSAGSDSLAKRQVDNTYVVFVCMDKQPVKGRKHVADVTAAAVDCFRPEGRVCVALGAMEGKHEQALERALGAGAESGAQA